MVMKFTPYPLNSNPDRDTKPNSQNNWIRIVLKISLLVAILLIPFNVILWIGTSNNSPKGSILGMTITAIILSFCGTFALWNVSTTGTKYRTPKIIIGFTISGFFLFAGYLAQARVIGDMLTGIQEELCILEYYKDHGKVSSNNNNHDFYIKVNTFSKELNIAMPPSYGDELKLQIGKQIRIGYYKRLKQIEYIEFDPEYSDTSEI